MPRPRLRWSQLGGVRLYGGPDLSGAVERSTGAAMAVAAPVSAPPRPQFPGASALAAALNAPSLRLLPRSVVVTGTERVSQTTMRVLFRGQSRSIDFCARHILGSTDYERAPAVPGDAHACDVVVVDHPLLGLDPLDRHPALHVPQWVRQRVELAASWQQTLERLPRSIRKRIASELRTPLDVGLESAPAAFPDFYRALYAPYLRERFGSAAIVPSERAFLRQTHGAVLLTLRVAGELVGATVLKQAGDTLLISRSALSLRHSLRYRSDLLDYFCFLVAELTGARWLDFGASRPHVEDGLLLNKAKWRPRLAPSGAWKHSIHIRPVSRSSATFGFLQRNGFIERRGGTFTVRCLRERAPAADEALRLGTLATRVGLDEWSVAYRGADEAPAGLAAAAPRVALRRLEAGTDCVRSWLGRP
jgi:hypothetical protein